MSIDFGKKRIGVAISDPSRLIAQGLPTLEHCGLSNVLDALTRLITDYNVLKIIVGYPISLSGDLNQQATYVERFIRALEGVVDVPVLRLDERFTSKIAKRTLKELGISPSRSKGKVDELSAAVLLQDYLDMQTETELR